MIFASGRPILVLPTASRARPLELGTVAVAWDFSRAAARAVSDALPLLERAKNARIVTVIDEKDFDTSHSAEELAKNLARHGIEVVLDKIDAGGKPIGTVLETYVRAHTGSTCLSWEPTATPVGANSSSAARPRACCRGRRFRLCFRIDSRLA